MEYSDDEVRDNIKYYRSQKNWRIVQKEKSHTSEMWKNGVVIQPVKGGDAQWLCLRSRECEAKGYSVAIGKDFSSSNAVKHLRSVHNIESARSRKMSAKKLSRTVSIDELTKVCSFVYLKFVLIVCLV